MLTSDAEELSSKYLQFYLVEVTAEDSQVVEQILVNESDYVGRRSSTNLKVSGNPHKPECRDLWEREIKPSEFVMKTIKEGYELPFRETPPQLALKGTTDRPVRIRYLSERRFSLPRRSRCCFKTSQSLHCLLRNHIPDLSG